MRPHDSISCGFDGVRVQNVLVERWAKNGASFNQPALIQECYEKAILAITNSGISYEKGEESTK